ncbi:unnamed protein product [Urochloa decumbens]|uniref:Uncharacterized protein n=1 Tax=Urochloa decumbens TaxID=240449 RepID=A0ABC9BEH8_9POAL
MSSRRSSPSSRLTTWRASSALPASARPGAGSGSSGRRPPLLGVICNLGVGGAARFVPTSPFRLSRPDLTGWLALDARHGRILLASLAEGRAPVPGRVVVWDPVAAERVDLPPLPRHLELQASPWSSWNAAVLCATARDHLDCRRGPFLAALVAVNADSVFALLYSSAAAGWSPPTYLFEALSPLIWIARRAASLWIMQSTSCFRGALESSSTI